MRCSWEVRRSRSCMRVCVCVCVCVSVTRNIESSHKDSDLA